MVDHRGELAAFDELELGVGGGEGAGLLGEAARCDEDAAGCVLAGDDAEEFADGGDADLPRAPVLALDEGALAVEQETAVRQWWDSDDGVAV